MTLSGGMLRDYIFFGGERISVYTPTSAILAFFDDHLGSTSKFESVSSAGAVTLEFDADYAPFGRVREFGSDLYDPAFKFMGKEYDGETGLDNFGARHNDPTIGRFISADWSSVPAPVPYANLTNPQTLNLYALVRDNPETFADLDGHNSGPQDCWVDFCAGSMQTGAALEGDGPPQSQNKGIATADDTTEVAQQLADQINKDAQRPDQIAKRQEASPCLCDPGDHVFITVAGGLGIGFHVKLGKLVKVGAEVSVQSEGKYTLSGKADVSAAKKAEVSGAVDDYGLALGSSSDKTTHYDRLNGPPGATTEKSNSFGLHVLTPHSGSVSFDSGYSYEVGGCFVVCLSIGIGVQK